VPLLMAFDALQAQGYRVEKTYLASSALIADALARGDADIGMLNNQTLWIAISKGAAVRTIAQFTGTTSVLAATQEVRSCAELSNRRVGMPAASGLASTLFQSYLKENYPGVTPQVLVIPESAGRMAALLAGEIDASNLPGEELLKLQGQAPGKFHILMSYAQAFPKLQVDGLHVRRSWAEENPQAVKDFLRALLNVYQQITANPQLLYDESVKRLSLDPATAKAICDAHLQMGVWHAGGGLTVKNVQYTLDFLTSTGALQPGLKVEDVADLSYLNAVLDESGFRKSLPLEAE
jgi:ABC-type nitrate/sulfonate/bicarbonate transport system substrate-binding protein